MFDYLPRWIQSTILVEGMRKFSKLLKFSFYIFDPLPENFVKILFFQLLEVEILHFLSRTTTGHLEKD